MSIDFLIFRFWKWDWKLIVFWDVRVLVFEYIGGWEGLVFLKVLEFVGIRLLKVNNR